MSRIKHVIENKLQNNNNHNINTKFTPSREKPTINNKFIIGPWPKEAKSISPSHFGTLQWRITTISIRLKPF